ncbi:MAG: protein phosphatase 2C domain-containing protein [Ottowia sp.]|nr:protein phosphatase 2C domain-containing protein [Ottowia sp.]
MEDQYRIEAAAGLHRGDRKYQQDQFALWSHVRVNGCIMGVIADGMGGKTGGKAAAEQVILTARQLFNRYAPESDDGGVLLQQIAMEAHAMIRLTAIASEQSPHSTIAAFILNPGGKCYSVHCGDSRVYKFRGAELVHQSSDHSYVQTLVEHGAITPEEALVHPQSNVLTACLGMDDTPTVVSAQLQRMAVGDSLLLCSDGLWHYFTTQELAMVIDTLPASDACRFLIKKAHERADGGGDNLSALVLKIKLARTQARPAPLRRKG